MLVASNIYGPFVLLPEELQRLALQLVYYFDALPAKLLKALTACCTAPHTVILFVFLLRCPVTHSSHHQRVI